MRKMAFKDRKAKLVAVSVDLNKKTISWRTAGKLPEHLDQASSMHEEWMGLYSSRQSLRPSSSTAPLGSGGGNASVSSQTQSEFSPTRGQLRGQKSSCNLSKITSIHFGPVTSNMRTVVSTTKMLQPWRCWSFEVKRPRPRSYDFVALGDKDAEHFVLGEYLTRSLAHGSESLVSIPKWLNSRAPSPFHGCSGHRLYACIPSCRSPTRVPDCHPERPGVYSQRLPATRGLTLTYAHRAMHTAKWRDILLVLLAPENQLPRCGKRHL